MSAEFAVEKNAGIIMENEFDDFDTQLQIEDIDSYDEDYFHVAPEPPEEPEWCDRCGSYHPAQFDC